MFNVGGGEILLIALLALIVVGPEQLPGLLRKLGYYAGQARQMSNALRAEFMAGAEPFQDSMREFQRGMTDFSNTVADAADPNRWGSGTSEDPVVPRGFAEETADDSTGEAAEAEPIPIPERKKKLEITPPPNPWAPLPGSGADTEPADRNGDADPSSDDAGGPAASVHGEESVPDQAVAPAVPPPPPLTGYRGDIEDPVVDSEEPEPDEEPV